MKVVYTPRARSDLDAIYIYLNERSPIAEPQFSRRFATELQSWRTFP
jgi:plasmid stabilization system protein ParE